LLFPYLFLLAFLKAILLSPYLFLLAFLKAILLAFLKAILLSPICFCSLFHNFVDKSDFARFFITSWIKAILLHFFQKWIFKSG
jgi:hypothetical protein